MEKNSLSLKKRLVDGETVKGIFVTELRTSHMGLILDSTGCDFCIFDMEHGTYTTKDLAEMLPGFYSRRCKPLVRVPAIRREFFQSAMDLGVAGFVVPMVESADDVRACLDLMKFPPNGKRGLSYSCPSTSFRVCDRDSYTTNMNEYLLLVIQIETEKGLENLNDILAVPGIDVVFVGNADLALSLGVMNDFEKGPLHDAVRYVFQTASSLGIACGGNYPNPEDAGLFREDGLCFISLDTDIERFILGLSAGIKRLNGGLNARRAAVNLFEKESVASGGDATKQTAE